MLYNKKTGQPVSIPARHELTDNQKRNVIEKLEPLPTKHDKFFRLDQRAKIEL